MLVAALHRQDDSLYHLEESILLDTTGRPSFLGVVLVAKGAHAEALREEFEKHGPENFATARLQLCANRFVHARRVGALEHRDDRETNVFSVAEVFEIDGFLTRQPGRGLYQFSLPNSLVMTALALPEVAPRRAPFALPHPCVMVHSIEIKTPGLRPAPMPCRTVNSAFLNFERVMASVKGNWAMTLKLSTLADAVPPDQVAEHRKTIFEIQSASVCSLLVRKGHPYPRMRRSFGKLPPPARDVSRRAEIPRAGPEACASPPNACASPHSACASPPNAPAPAPKPQSAEPPASGAFAPLDTSNFPDPAALPATPMAATPAKLPTQSASPESPGKTRSHRRHKRTQDTSKSLSVATVIGIIAGVILGVLIFLLAR